MWAKNHIEEVFKARNNPVSSKHIDPWLIIGGNRGGSGSVGKLFLYDEIKLYLLLNHQNTNHSKINYSKPQP